MISNAILAIAHLYCNTLQQQTPVSGASLHMHLGRLPLPIATPPLPKIPLAPSYNPQHALGFLLSL